VSGPRTTLPPRASLRLPALLVLATLLVCAALPGCGPHRPRHILLIVVDTLRRDHLSPYGGWVPTPNLEALAQKGQVFQNVFASFHQTSMSMAAIFTGRTPSIESADPSKSLPWNSSTWCGLSRLAGAANDTCIPHGLPTLAERLRDAGYTTIGVASNQFLYEPSGFSRGFDTWIEVDRRAATVGARSRRGVADPRNSRTWKTVNRDALRAVDGSPGGRTFLYVHYIDVHDYRFHKRTYEESVELEDSAIGALLEGLGHRGFLEDSVVIVTSDHGERLGEDHRFPGELPNNFGHYGNPSFEELLKIPLIVSPAVFADPNRFLRTEDLYDLIGQVAGLPPVHASDLSDGELYLSEMFFRTFRRGHWKTLVRRSDGRVFLYDLERDPFERIDLAARDPERVKSEKERSDAIARELRAGPASRKEMSEDDRERLRSLGYLDDTKE
jgi:arylsulfatase A-like enzyme